MWRHNGTKYNTSKIKTVIDGIKFDSRKEGQVYVTLKLMEKSGDIKDLQLQPVFELQPKFRFKGKTIRAIKYIADFMFYDNKQNRVRVIDVKGMKTKEFLIKEKLFLYKYQPLMIEYEV